VAIVHKRSKQAADRLYVGLATFSFPRRIRGREGTDDETVFVEYLPIREATDARFMEQATAGEVLGFEADRIGPPRIGEALHNFGVTAREGILSVAGIPE
jgi:hypothetical protein